MTRTDQTILALYRCPMTAIRLAHEIDCHPSIARRCLCDLRNRMVLKATKNLPKVYSLTEFGRQEAVRLKQKTGMPMVEHAAATQPNSVFALGAM